MNEKPEHTSDEDIGIVEAQTTPVKAQMQRHADHQQMLREHKERKIKAREDHRKGLHKIRFVASSLR